jgi:NADPH:quinone reductase-like Zn-dependent oxidoreductase
LGAKVVAAVRRPEQAAALQELGYETLLLGPPEALSEQVLQKFGAYADVIFETTGAWLPPAITASAKHGAICIIAPPGMGKLHVNFPVLDFYRRGLTLFGVNTLLHDTVACAKMLAEFSGLFQSGALPPPPRPREIRLADGLEAYRLVHEGYSGKIVLTPDRAG